MNNFSMTGVSEPVSLRAMVIHLSSGSRAGAGLIATRSASDVYVSTYSPSPTMEPSPMPTPIPTPAPTTVDYKLRAKANEATRSAASIANITMYPGYSGSYRSVAGTVVVEDTDSGIKITGTLTGVEASATGGIHIHEGVSCATTSDPGGHYYEGMSSDPWSTTSVNASLFF
jgi:hypothetical protein